MCFWCILLYILRAFCRICTTKPQFSKNCGFLLAEHFKNSGRENVTKSWRSHLTPAENAPFCAAHAQPEFLWKAKHPARCSCRRKELLSSFYVIILSNSANLFAKPPAPQARKQCIHISSKRWMQWPLLPKPNAEPGSLFENSLLNQFVLCKSTNCSACCLIIAHNSPAARTFERNMKKTARFFDCCRRRKERCGT